MADFTTWTRVNLERVATELQTDNLRLRAANEQLKTERHQALTAWRAEICRQASTELKVEATR